MEHGPGGPLRVFRGVLQARGFVFCDEGDAEAPQFGPLQLKEGEEQLIAAGVEASSTDAPQQGIGCTLQDAGRTFWSSGGSRGPEAVEFLLYKLRSPLCLVRAVRLTVFRARYQFGEPLYPPAHVSFQAGPSPWALAPPSLMFPVAATDAPQVFPLPADLPAGRYLRLNLHGKRQQQLEDMQWYHAIQRVEAFGRQLPPPAVASLRSWAAREALPAAAPGAVPAYLVAGMLEAEAERRASGQEQQQQQQQGRQRKVQQQQGQPAAMEPGGNGEQAAAARSAADGDSSSDGSPMQPG